MVNKIKCNINIILISESQKEKRNKGEHTTGDE